jgi:hypothetical protein
MFVTGDGVEVKPFRSHLWYLRSLTGWPERPEAVLAGRQSSKPPQLGLTHQMSAPE